MLNRIGLALLLTAFVLASGLVPFGKVYGADAATPAPKPKPLISRSANGDWLRLHSEPCPTATGWLKDQLRRAQWFYKGKYYDSCWRLGRNTTNGSFFVLSLDANKEMSIQPATAFEEDGGV